MFRAGTECIPAWEAMVKIVEELKLPIVTRIIPFYTQVKIMQVYDI